MERDIFPFLWLNFLICNQSVPCPFLIAASWPECRFLRRQVRWSGISISKKFPQFVVIHTVKGFSIVNEAEVDVFLEFLCFLYDPVDVGNLISDFSAFSKLSLYIWKFFVDVLLMLTWRILSITLLAFEMSKIVLSVVWTFFGIVLLWDLESKLTFSSPVGAAEFSKSAGIMSAAFQQHHLLGFEIAQLEFHHLH